MIASDADLVVFLRQHGAAELDHPGGRLVDHLLRVRDLLGSWGASDVLRVAGLCHAVYGTAGFPRPLLEPTRRADFARLVGPEAEELVYRYGSADRARLWPQLGTGDEAQLHDRLTGATHRIRGQQLRDFVELTVANELDLARHDPVFAAATWPGLWDQFRRWRTLLSIPAWSTCTEFGSPSAGSR